MASLAPDVRLAVELIGLVDLPRWGRIGEGLLHSTPRIHHEDADHLDDLLAWAAAHVDKPRSYVEAAVVNAARVLQDLNLVLRYEMDFRDNHYWVTQWYRRSYGQPGHTRRVEEFGVHVALVNNLAIELNRAWNLVIDRSRQADADVLVDTASAVVPTGPPNAPVEAVRYSNEESEQSQPYPGLACFPAAVEGRAAGLLGNTTGAEPRTVAAFTEWIDHIVKEHGPHSEPPSTTELPFTLSKSPQRTNIDGLGARARPPSPWQAIAGILGAGSVLAGLLASFPWLVGATVGGALAAGVLHRHVWRVPPQPIPAAAVVAVAVACAVLAELVADDGDERSAAKSTAERLDAVLPDPEDLPAGFTVPLRLPAGAKAIDADELCGKKPRAEGLQDERDAIYANRARSDTSTVLFNRVV